MKLIQALILGSVSAISISAFANEAQPLPETTEQAAVVTEAAEGQPVIVTTQAPAAEDATSAAAEAQAGEPTTEAAAEEQEQKDVQK